MLQFSFKKGKLTSKAGARFVELLGGDDLAFDNLYCVAFQMLDRQWLAKRATYMEFNVNYIPCFMFLVCEFIELGFSPFISLLLSPPLIFSPSFRRFSSPQECNWSKNFHWKAFRAYETCRRTEC